MKIFKYISASIGLLFTVACSDLDLHPIDYNDSDNFWKNEAQIQSFIIGAHAQFRGHAFNYWEMGEERGGTLVPDGASSIGQNILGSSVKTQNFTVDNPNNSSWFNFYGRILNLNIAILKINEVSFLSEANKNYYLGQMYGMRAWYYFWLYRTYGGVPIKTGTEIMERAPKTADPLYTPRSTPKETLDFIKSDINASENHFTASGRQTTLQRSRWTYYATLVLKAEIYLWSAKVTTGDQAPTDIPGDLATAKAALDKVRDSGQFQLLANTSTSTNDSFSRVFAHNNKENREIIFTMPYLENEASTPFGAFLYSPSLFGSNMFNDSGYLNYDPLRIGSGNLFHEYKYSLFTQFDARDGRRDATFMDFYSPTNYSIEGLVLRKYLGTINSAGSRVFTSDIPIYRYADVVLLYAEIVNKEGGDPSSYINDIRKRAYGDSNFTGSVVYTNRSFAENELAILRERDKEFVAESKRWFDVRRMQSADLKPLVFSAAANYANKGTTTVTPLLNEATEAYKLLWPVDKEVINHDPTVTQTPGYPRTGN